MIEKTSHKNNIEDMHYHIDQIGSDLLLWEIIIHWREMDDKIKNEIFWPIINKLDDGMFDK